MSTTYLKGRPSGISPLDHKVIKIMMCFPTLESSLLITRDHEDGDRVGSYLGMKRTPLLVWSWVYYFKYPNIILFFAGDMVNVLLDEKRKCLVRMQMAQERAQQLPHPSRNRETRLCETSKGDKARPFQALKRRRTPLGHPWVVRRNKGKRKPETNPPLLILPCGTILLMSWSFLTVISLSLQIS